MVKTPGLPQLSTSSTTSYNSSLYHSPVAQAQTGTDQFIITHPPRSLFTEVYLPLKGKVLLKEALPLPGAWYTVGAYYMSVD